MCCIFIFVYFIAYCIDYCIAYCIPYCIAYWIAYCIAYWTAYCIDFRHSNIPTLCFRQQSETEHAWPAILAFLFRFRGLVSLASTFSGISNFLLDFLVASQGKRYYVYTYIYIYIYMYIRNIVSFTTCNWFLILTFYI